MSNINDTAAHARVEQYQGWANRETWALMLHVNNDQELYAEFREVARTDANRAEAAATAQVAVKDRAEILFTRTGYTDEFGDEWPAALANIAAEVGSFWRVDWAEVTAALLED